MEDAWSVYYSPICATDAHNFVLKAVHLISTSLDWGCHKKLSYLNIKPSKHCHKNLQINGKGILLSTWWLGKIFLNASTLEGFENSQFL